MSRKLFVFDCDGVLTEDKSSWGLLHEYFGSRDNSYFARLYRNGLITYLDWMKIDIALMIHSYGKPIKKREVEYAFSRVRVKPEAKSVILEIKRRGHIVAVVSSGIDILVERVCRELGIEICLSNSLMFYNDELIPGGIARVPLKEKKDVIAKLSNELNIGLENTIYIGDSEWDIEVFKAVPLSIAIEPCEEACNYATFRVKSLREILDLPIFT